MHTFACRAPADLHDARTHAPRRSQRLDKTGIVQIAAKLGVSPSTVSRALRPETAHLVREDRRKEILDLAEKQHFLPNLGARMLRKGVNTTLTVVVPLDENIFFSEFYGRFLAGTLHAAAARGWGCTSARSAARRARASARRCSTWRSTPRGSSTWPSRCRRPTCRN
ncbi:hypothetical protein [Oleiharenicola sp. Vm1]|uniref:hypothetical protein n=1 Tax=Oleiharenicola sp. Vm1 TaxID=3398393 RepID=UPI0039F5A49C